ncbi:hypothetical protein EYF80_041803 [Liparis tanakae]|uniref:Uncharacterized protein n=1 Tax=Liparis tanakae TaxID=230148 RepID=A0A4Z2G460_9TELE|nr:hypothetical protein EYF80_041803 [Liparis tanakae]
MPLASRVRIWFSTSLMVLAMVVGQLVLQGAVHLDGYPADFLPTDATVTNEAQLCEEEALCTLRRVGLDRVGGVPYLHLGLDVGADRVGLRGELGSQRVVGVLFVELVLQGGVGSAQLDAVALGDLLHLGLDGLDGLPLLVGLCQGGLELLVGRDETLRRLKHLRYKRASWRIPFTAVCRISLDRSPGSPRCCGR